MALLSESYYVQAQLSISADRLLQCLPWTLRNRWSFSWLQFLVKRVQAFAGQIWMVDEKLSQGDENCLKQITATDKIG